MLDYKELISFIVYTWQPLWCSGQVWPAVPADRRVLDSTSGMVSLVNDLFVVANRGNWSALIFCFIPIQIFPERLLSLKLWYCR